MRQDRRVPGKKGRECSGRGLLARPCALHRRGAVGWRSLNRTSQAETLHGLLRGAHECPTKHGTTEASVAATLRKALRNLRASHC